MTAPEEQAGRIECLECGRWYRALSSHLATHGLTAAEYREAHGLGATTPLAAVDLREGWSESTQARVDAGEVISVRRRYDPLAAGRERNTMHRETASRPAVRAAHQVGIVKGRTTAHDNSRRRLDDIARRLGHASWVELIHETSSWQLTEVARMVGRDPRTIAYWRRQLVGRPPTRDDRARALGYDSWADAIERTRHLTEKAAAEVLGVGSSTIGRHRANGQSREPNPLLREM